MSENIDNLLLENLKGLRNELKSFRAKAEEEFGDIKARLCSLERGQAKGHSEYADIYGEHARHQSSIDRLAERLDKIERRLDLTD